MSSINSISLASSSSPSCRQVDRSCCRSQHGVVRALRRVDIEILQVGIALYYDYVFNVNILHIINFTSLLFSLFLSLLSSLLSLLVSLCIITIIIIIIIPIIIVVITTIVIPINIGIMIYYYHYDCHYYYHYLFNHDYYHHCYHYYYSYHSCLLSLSWSPL